MHIAATSANAPPMHFGVHNLCLAYKALEQELVLFLLTCT